MTDRRKNLLCLAALLGLLTLFFSKILFTDRIVRAPDIINESYWWMKSYADISLRDLFNINLVATWDPNINSGLTNNGGLASQQFLLYQRFILHFIPAPASVAWFMVLHLFLGGAGVFCCCRLIGCSRWASFFGGLVFALAPENASLINAGHVMKIATIGFAPWAFYFIERGFQTRRLVFFMTTAVVLAFQFFNTHWQIAFYTCLSLGAYGILRSIGILFSDDEKKEFPAARLFGCNLVLLAFFLTTVSISLLPLADWSKETNRGVQSGANQGKGGLDREEAMSWSLPPEELTGFVIPGFFGLSRQEAGENPASIRSYYWGRMVFTQTVSYMGLIPWLLAPLALIFRRDRYTWLAIAAIAGGVLFSMGKYTPFYNLLFDAFPGINRFRVPKMIMFIPVMGLSVLAGRGLDLLREEWVRTTVAFRRYLLGIGMFAFSLCLLLVFEAAGRDFWISRLYEMLAQPTRYEQGPQLVMQRWNNLVLETGIAAGLGLICAAVLVAFNRGWLSARLLPFLLLALFVGDVARVNDKFLFLVKVPEKSLRSKTPVIEFLQRESKDYRVLPMNGGDPMQYATSGVPVMFTSNPVQQRRWQEFLDVFNLNSPMPDLLNVKYLVMNSEQYAQEKTQLSPKYQPVFQSPDKRELLLENRAVLPKAWLVPSAMVVQDRVQALQILQNPSFNPGLVALVENPAPLDLLAPDQRPQAPPGTVSINRSEGERITLTATPAMNSLLVLGEKYFQGWKARIDGKPAQIYPVDHVLRGVYLTPGKHSVEFEFDPLPFKIGKYLTLTSFALFAVVLVREWFLRRRKVNASA
ncbi:MAG: hypothetical protein HXX11_13400 [Desulfuromonadales bacterium]|nr:hypothetical protein [Desulfuromonadales bacterium]